jgi:hypothetical protein
MRAKGYAFEPLERPHGNLPGLLQATRAPSPTKRFTGSLAHVPINTTRHLGSGRIAPQADVGPRRDDVNAMDHLALPAGVVPLVPCEPIGRASTMRRRVP